MKRRHLADVAMAGLLVLGVAPTAAGTASAGGRTLTVGKSGAQYRTIQAAADASKPGDTILISAGVYREALTPKSGAAGRAITYRAAAGARVVLDGGKTLKSGNGLLNLDGTSWLKFDGIVVTKSPTHGVYGYQSKHISFSRCEVSSSSDGGLVLVDSSDLVVTAARSTTTTTRAPARTTRRCRSPSVPGSTYGTITCTTMVRKGSTPSTATTRPA